MDEHEWDDHPKKAASRPPAWRPTHSAAAVLCASISSKSLPGLAALTAQADRSKQAPPEQLAGESRGPSRTKKEAVQSVARKASPPGHKCPLPRQPDERPR